MSTRIHFNNVQELYVNGKQEPFYVDECGVKEFFLKYNYRDSAGWFKEIVFDLFKIGFGNIKTSNKMILDFEFEEESIESNFVLAGGTITSVNSSKQNLIFSANEHNIYYSVDAKGYMYTNKPDTLSLEINYSRTFFEKYLPNISIFKDFKKLLAKKIPGLLSAHNYPLTSKMNFIINDIINCKWKGSFRKMYMESKVLELLLEQLNQIVHYNNNEPLQHGKFKNVIDKLHEAKMILENDFNSSLSLKSLALKVGTNEFSLKKGFKSVFGTTVFGYLHDIKMNKAHEMLLENKYSVGEVSDFVGYKNPQHFTVAFKKKFGITPSNLNKL